MYKQDVKIKAIEGCSCIKYEEKRNKNLLRASLQKVIALENKNSGMFKDVIGHIKHKPEAIDQDRYRGALVRARAEHWTIGEAPTKRSLGIEKTQARRNMIKEIETNGYVTSEKEEVELAFFDYYKALFALRETDLEKFKRDFIGALSHLDDETKNGSNNPSRLRKLSAPSKTSFRASHRVLTRLVRRSIYI